MSKPKKPTKNKPAPKPHKPAPKPAPAKERAPAPEPVVVEEPENPSADQLTVQTIQRGLPPTTAAERALYVARATDDKRTEIGDGTKGRKVLRDVTKLLVRVVKDHAAYPKEVEAEYPLSAIRYLADLLATLATQVIADAAALAKRGGARGTASSAEQTARDARSTLARKLERFSRHRAADKAALDAARGESRTQSELTDSTGRLVALARGWLADAARAPLLAVNGCTQAIVDAADAARAALAAGESGALLEGPAAQNDSPATNRCEGAALVEAEAAYDAWVDLEEQTGGLIKRLPLGTGIQRAIGPQRRRLKNKPAPAPPPAPAPSPDPTQPS